MKGKAMIAGVMDCSTGPACAMAFGSGAGWPLWPSARNAGGADQRLRTLGVTRRMEEPDEQDLLSVQLLERVAAGDRDAFRQLYDLHAARLHAFALRITRQGPLAADAVHDTFLQVWRNAARYDASRGAPRAWLFGLVRYRALDIVRKHGREMPSEDFPETEDTEPDPLQRLATRQSAAALHACLGQLPSERRKLLMLAFVEGQTHADLSTRLALPLGTIKSWIRRSLMALRRCLDDTP